ncbi:hypothetical protein POTOM_023765 [Populus tomentosa]|uniref:Glycerol-3-phosphate acyltransferase RAM2/GPAT1-8 HAD-like domain-containing protein n=1 Tax=Populus tomentosa TaxID=118781 RepID=A0A8X8A0H3_POPTO|nr:hypothetical protein POTOM_023765 [Populus tomentosa]
MVSFPTVDKCASIGKEKHSVVADMDGTLLRGRSSFPYFALLSFEGGGIFRLLFLLLNSPLAGLLYYFVSESAGIKVRATGFVQSPAVLVGKNKADALKKAFGETQPEIGLGDRHTDAPFMALCKEGYIVPPKPEVEAVTTDKLPKPVIFHDGRLVQKPTPLSALLIVLWIPIGFILACLRIAAGSLLPIPMVYYGFWALGVRVTIKGTPPPPAKKSIGQSGVLFVCSHRTLLDPIFLSTALGRPIPAVTYSLSRLSEIISPIKTVRLSRDRAADASMIKKLLEEDELVPVAMVNRMSMFHGTTARGWKGMDPFYFFMNPGPAYEVTFLNKLPPELTLSGGKSSHEVANYIQRVIAATLSYECTSFTRGDKYRALAGNDGNVVEKTKVQANE